jgi:diaminopimelate decarboxylase
MPPRVTDWGFSLGAGGALKVGGVDVLSIARRHGTPLHVIDEEGVRSRARAFRRTFADTYRGATSVHYAFKCNNTPGIAAMVLAEGLKPEVGTEYEWTLARRLGAPVEELIVNGPFKATLLERAIREGAGLLVIDSLAELRDAAGIAARVGRRPRILLRINPDYVPQGMNRASATGSRKASVFGLDPRTGELRQALTELHGAKQVHFAGFHCHIGTGIRAPEDYEQPLHRLMDYVAQASAAGHPIEVLNVGGGFGVATSRELSTRQFLVYQATGRLPRPPRPDAFPALDAFARAISAPITARCHRDRLPLPRLIIEPGRAVASSAGLLLVTIGRIKHRAGVGTWAITDGGAGTVAFPLFYEYHEILLCRAPQARRTHTYAIVGPTCHSADWVYRRKRMPALAEGDLLAICDAGAYFTVQESNFGFPRPPIVALRRGAARLLRRRESFEEMVMRDEQWEPCHARENSAPGAERPAVLCS